MPYANHADYLRYQRAYYRKHKDDPRYRALNCLRTSRWRARLRTRVFKRDSFTCVYCQRALDRFKLTLDHCRPKSQGGPTRYENLLTACLQCNQERGDRPYEWFRLLKQTGAPF